MYWWHAVILGLVEGITEYLPVSSTGHLIITSDLLGVFNRDSANAVKAFNVAIQGGAILAVLGLYWPRFEQMLLGIAGQSAEGRRLLINVIVAFLPAAVVGFVAHKYIEQLLFKPVPVIAAFAVGGVYMIVVEQWRKIRAKKTSPGVDASQIGNDLEALTPKGALLIGVMQILSMWPGTSRSMMTITGGVFAGLKPRAAAEFSFLLGMPTLLAATLYVLAKDFYRSMVKNQDSMFVGLGWAPSLLGMLVAAVSAGFAVRWLVNFLNKHGLTPFGVYRLVLAGVLAYLVHAGRVTVEPEDHGKADPNRQIKLLTVPADAPLEDAKPEGQK